MEEIRYNLRSLYQGFDDPEFLNDLTKASEKINQLSEFVEKNCTNYEDFPNKLKSFISFQEVYSKLIGNLSAFISLTISADTTNDDASKYQAKLQTLTTDATIYYTKIKKYIGNYEFLDEVINSNEFKEYAFFLTQIKNEVGRLLSDQEEVIISKMRQTASSSWNLLQSLLTSKVDVEVHLDGEIKVMTLSSIVNLMRSKNPEERKAAYLATQKAYEKIEDSVAMCLSSIKGEVNYTSKLRGYESALAESLDKSRTKQQTLDAMLQAMHEYLPFFHEYLKRKAKLLGHEGGLPSYDLNAPLGEVNYKFTIDEAKDFIIANFATFSEKLAKLAQKAFDNNWIDVYPRRGKRGGAFCQNIRSIKESRVLTNFNGNLKDVVTLSHELGHAYHGECIFENNILSSSYPMPVAETASTFCETLVMNAVIGRCNESEKVTLLDTVLQGHTAIICDILSRFIFEKEVFERRLDHPVNAKELNSIMIEAIKKAYGDGLNHEYSNPYAWLNKPHYYRPGLSFYNWPYAFGLLFAKGLYAQYLKDKERFVSFYDEILKATGKMNVEEVANLAGIDVTDVNFWRSSLELIKQDIDLFLDLTK